MLKKEGLGVLYCGKWTEEESKNLDKTLEILEGKFKEKKKILLPKSNATRNIILIQPKNFCPEIYPRKVGKPEKNPLRNYFFDNLLATLSPNFSFKVLNLFTTFFGFTWSSKTLNNWPSETSTSSKFALDPGNQ